jgi:hypothetical protein
MARQLPTMATMMLDKEARSGTMQYMRAIVTTAAVIMLALVAAPALAQQVDIEVLPPERERGPVVITPGDQYEAGRPSDYNNYPQPLPRVKFDPAFIRPMSARTQTPTSTGRAGIAGWTAPSTPVGSQQIWKEDTGLFALGFTVEWGGPPPPSARRPAPAPR